MPVNFLEYSLKLLSQRRYSCQQISAKLTKKGASFEVIQSVLQRLKEWKYLDDLDFSQSYVRTRQRLSPCGKALLRFELMKKGIAKDTIDQVLDHSLLSEEEIAGKALEKKLPQLQKLSLLERRKKALYFLKSRGFRPDIVYELIKKL